MNTGRSFSFRLSPFQTILIGFVIVILIGSFILMLPISSRSGQVTPFFDCLFMSTSVTCVTGLLLYDTAAYWSPFGQAVILCLIQIGGLGVVTVASSVAVLAGRKIGLAQRNTLQESISAPQIGGIDRDTGHPSAASCDDKGLRACQGCLVFRVSRDKRLLQRGSRSHGGR